MIRARFSEWRWSYSGLPPITANGTQKDRVIQEAYIFFGEEDEVSQKTPVLLEWDFAYYKAFQCIPEWNQNSTQRRLHSIKFWESCISITSKTDVVMERDNVALYCVLFLEKRTWQLVELLTVSQQSWNSS